MRVVITGGTGFIGRPLVAELAGLGYECTVLTRDPRRAAKLGLPDTVKFAVGDSLPAADVVIHLAGESIAGLWTPQKKRAILASRVEGTRRLVAALRTAKVKPHTLLAASAVGYYGHRPGEMLDESTPADPRKSFRAEVCRAWEAAANEADALGIRVINLRIGNVMDPAGGYLGGLLPIHRALGGFVLGNPAAAIPWISREDCVRLITFALANERWYGPLNLTAPAPITHTEFAESLSARFRRRVLGRIPTGPLRFALGDLASTLLDDQAVVPQKALSAGYTWRNPTWESWLDATFPDAVRTAGCQLARSAKRCGVQDIGKAIFVLGLVLTVVGALLWKTGGVGGLGRLPGDIFVQKGHSTFYFPIVTCILISLAITLLGWLFRR